MFNSLCSSRYSDCRAVSVSQLAVVIVVASVTLGAAVSDATMSWSVRL